MWKLMGFWGSWWKALLMVSSPLWVLAGIWVLVWIVNGWTPGGSKYFWMNKTIRMLILICRSSWGHGFPNRNVQQCLFLQSFAGKIRSCAGWPSENHWVRRLFSHIHPHACACAHTRAYTFYLIHTRIHTCVLCLIMALNIFSEVMCNIHPFLVMQIAESEFLRR